MGQQVYFAAEESDCCTRQCCGPLRKGAISLFPISVYHTREIVSKTYQIGQTSFVRSFEMTILDNNSREVARFKRPFNCTCRCCLFPKKGVFAHLAAGFFANCAFVHFAAGFLFDTTSNCFATTLKTCLCISLRVPFFL